MQDGARLKALFGFTLLLLFCGIGNAAELRGHVSSPGEGAMEGVLVSARKAGSPITVTVATGKEGSFGFPALEAGRYALSIRAVGYELDGSPEVRVPEQKQPVELRLKKAPDLAAQLTNTEWFMSMPGSAEQKRPLIECMSCHTFERIARTKHGPGEMFEVLKRMTTYANNSTMQKVQVRKVERKYEEQNLRRLAAYLASVNLSSGAWTYPL